MVRGSARHYREAESSMASFTCSASLYVAFTVRRCSSVGRRRHFSTG